MLIRTCPAAFLLVLLLSAASSKTFCQTWEIFDQDYNLVQKIENVNIHILGNSMRINTTDEYLSLLSHEYESYATIDGASLYQYLEPWLIIKKEGKYGAFHEYGDQVLACEYENIQTYYNLLMGRKGNHFFIYDRGKKNLISIGTFESARFARNGQVIAKTPQGYFLPLSNQPNHMYQFLEDPSDDVILAKESSGYGLINRNGDYIMDPIIEEMRYISNNHFFGHNGNEYLLIKAQTLEAQIKYNSFHRISYENDIILEYIHGKLRRIMNYEGILLDIVGMTAVERSGKDYYNVSFRDDKTGLLNEKGNWEVKPTEIAQEILPGANGFYGALMDSLYGFVDSDGAAIITPQFDAVQKYAEGRCAVKKGITWGYIDTNGQLVIPYYYDKVGAFYRGFAIVEKNGKFNLINQQGETILKNNYDRISLIADNYYLTEDKSKFGLVDPIGNELALPIYDEIRRERYDHVLIREGDKYGVMKENGDYSLPIYYTEILFDEKNKKILAKNDAIVIPEVEVEIKGKRKSKKAGKEKGSVS